MNGSHFGSGYWPDDFFGLYFQPEAGGVIVGTLAGSFAGTSAFSGTLDPAEARDPGAKSKKWLYAVAPGALGAVSVSAAEAYDRAVRKQTEEKRRAPVVAPAYDDEEELIWLLAA